jgi:hypothetical protein
LAARLRGEAKIGAETPRQDVATSRGQAVFLPVFTMIYLTLGVPTN